MYLPDGDIVLSAFHVTEDTETLVYFRVDSLYLRRSSTVFNDILTMPSEICLNETYDGVVLMHVSDDAEELGQLLSILYNVS